MGFLNQLVMNVVIAGAVYVILTLGFNLLYGITKFLNVAYGATAAVGAYLVFLFCRQYALPLWLGILLAIVGAGVVSYLSDVLIFKKLRRQGAASTVHVIASIGLMLLLESAIAIFFTSQYQSLVSQDFLPPVYTVLGASITLVEAITLIVALLAFVCLAVILKRSKFGKLVRAVSDDEEVSRIMGVNSNRVISIVFFVSGAIAGLAGILVGFDVGIFPTMGFFFLLEAATASIVGGIGNVYGGVLGAFLLAFTENFGVWKINAIWKPAIAFGLLVLFLIFRPQGILQGVSKK